MPRLVWSLDAINDTQRLYRFLVDQNPVAARRAVGAIRKGVAILAQQLTIGRPVEHMDPSFREWLISFGGSGYVVLYRHEANASVILAVRHQKEVGY